jgi:restriction system protein
MTIPDYQSLMTPIVRALSDGREQTARSLRERVTRELGLSDDDLRALVPSGQKPLFSDRMSWAITYLAKAGLIERPRRGVCRITDRGREVLGSSLGRIDNDLLSRFPEFNEFRHRSPDQDSPGRTTLPSQDRATPEESLDVAYARLRAAIESELLDQVVAASPPFFERLVVELLVKMGYGGSLRDAGEQIGRSGDGGIDGIIKEDRLGLDVIHVQAKRWTDKSVGRPDVQSFAGSLDGVRAKKGIFITTSTFSADARAYVERIDKRIVLIDGHQLAALMYDYKVGTMPVASYDVSRVDLEFFDEE